MASEAEEQKQIEAEKARFFDALMKLPRFKGTMTYSAATQKVLMSLESFENMCALFSESILYGLKHPDNGNETVFPLPGVDYDTASNMAEKSGTILMHKIHTDWMEN